VGGGGGGLVGGMVGGWEGVGEGGVSNPPASGTLPIASVAVPAYYYENQINSHMGYQAPRQSEQKPADSGPRPDPDEGGNARGRGGITPGGRATSAGQKSSK